MRKNLSGALRKTKQKKASIRAIGVITGGGDCPGLNAAIRAVVKRADLDEVRVFGIYEGFKGLYEGNIKPLAPIDVAGIISRGGTILGTSRFNPLKEDGGIGRIRKNLAKLRIDTLINIGGEGTMRFSHELHKLGIKVIGVPKTIDNDVWGTDFTFGFDTAVNIAMEAIDRLHTNAESHNRIMIVEVMGRHAGWIATYSGIAGGADAILIPEQHFRMSRLMQILQQRQKVGKRFSIIVVSEDAKILLDMEQNPPALLHTPMHHDEYGNLKLGGIAGLLEGELRRRLPAEVRSTVLGYIQRGGSPTAYDRVLATRLGVAAVEWALRGRSGVMVALQGHDIATVPLSQVAKKLKTVDPQTYRVGEVFFG